MADEIPEKGGHIPPHIARNKPDCDKKPVIPDPCQLRKRSKKKASIRDVECLPQEEEIICPDIETTPHEPPLIKEPYKDIPNTPRPENPLDPVNDQDQIGNERRELSCPASQAAYDAISECASDVPAPDAQGNFATYGNTIVVPANTFFTPLENHDTPQAALDYVNSLADIAACEDLDCSFINDIQEGTCEDLLNADDLEFLHDLTKRGLISDIVGFIETTGDMDHSMVRGPGMGDGPNGGDASKITIPAGVYVDKVSKQGAQQKAIDAVKDALLAACYKCNPALTRPCPAGEEPTEGYSIPECSFSENPWEEDAAATQFKRIQERAKEFLEATQCVDVPPYTPIDICDPTFALVNPNEEDDCGEGDTEYKKGDATGPFHKTNDCDYEIELPKIPCPCGYTNSITIINPNEEEDCGGGDAEYKKGEISGEKLFEPDAAEPCHSETTLSLPQIPCPCGYEFRLAVKSAAGQSSVGQTLISKSDDDCTMTVTLWIPEIPDFDPDIFNQQWFINIVNEAVNAAAGHCVDGYEIDLDLQNPNCSGTPGTGDDSKPANDPANGGEGALCTHCDRGTGPSVDDWIACNGYANGDQVSFDGACYEVEDADLVNHEDNCNTDPAAGLGEAGWKVGSCGDDCYNRPKVEAYVHDLMNYENDVPVDFTLTVECVWDHTGEWVEDVTQQWVDVWWEKLDGTEEHEVVNLGNPSVTFSKVVNDYSSVEFRANGLPNEVPVWVYVNQPKEDEKCKIPLKLEFPDVCGEIKTISVSEAEEAEEEGGEEGKQGVIKIKSSKKEDADGDGEENKVLANICLTKKDVFDEEKDEGEPCCSLGIKSDEDIIIPDVCTDLNIVGVDDTELCVKVIQPKKNEQTGEVEDTVVSTLALRKMAIPKEGDEEPGDPECKLGFQALEGEGGEEQEPGEGGGSTEAKNEIRLPAGDDVTFCDKLKIRELSHEDNGTVKLLQKDPESSDPNETVEKGSLRLAKYDEENDECSLGIVAYTAEGGGPLDSITLDVGGGDVCAAIEADTDSPRTINVFVATNDGVANPIEQIGALTVTKEEKNDKCALGLKYDGSASGQDPDSGELIIPCAYVDPSSSEITLIDESGTPIPDAVIKLESSKDANNNDVFKLTPSSITIPTMSGYEEAEIDVCTPSGIERKTILVKQ
jgi:hypothetical protein